MKICAVYIYPTSQHGAEHAHYAERFVCSYLNHPPEKEHDMIVVSNGGNPNGVAHKQFSWITGTKFIVHDDSGKDVGGYQLAAQTIPCDLMVFFGGHSYIRRAGWLRRMVEAYQTDETALYGCTGHQGGGNIHPHVRTTGFWCNPKLVNEHPYRVMDNGQRYPYEHGPEGLTSWILSTGRKAWIVTANDMKPLSQCDSLQGGYQNGRQENLLVGDRMCRPPYFHWA